MIELVGVSGYETLSDMISRAREWETDLEHIGKRGPDQVHLLEGPGKRLKSSIQLLRG